MVALVLLVQLSEDLITEWYSCSRTHNTVLNSAPASPMCSSTFFSCPVDCPSPGFVTWSSFPTCWLSTFFQSSKVPDFLFLTCQQVVKQRIWGDSCIVKWHHSSPVFSWISLGSRSEWLTRIRFYLQAGSLLACRVRTLSPRRWWQCWLLR